MKISWLLFDADNTLLDFSSASKKAFFLTARAHRLTEDQIDYNVYSEINHAIWKAFENKEIDAKTIRAVRFAKYFERMKVTGIGGLDFNQAYLQELVRQSNVNAGVMPLLDALKGKIKMSIVTNGLREVQKPRLERLEMMHYFDSIIVSDEIGVAKPDLAFFDYVFSTISPIPPKDEIMIIGDSLYSDIQGGKNARIKTCWISHGKENTTDIKPDFTIESALEIISLLDTSLVDISLLDTF